MCERLWTLPEYDRLRALLRKMREDAGLTQRDLAGKLKRRHSWVYNCEVANRRVDITEFCAWCAACGKDPIKVMRHYLRN